MTGRRLVTLALVLAAAPAVARAQHEVGVVVTGDAMSQAPTSAMIKHWLEQHGRVLDPGALTPDAINQLSDCFVMDDSSCAAAIVAAQAHSQAIVFARIDASGKDRKISIYWLARGQPAGVQRSDCKQCSDDALQITVGAMLSVLAGSAPAAAAAPASPAVVHAEVAPPAQPAPHGLAVGAELGEPTSATVAFAAGRLLLDAALGTGTFAGPGVSAHADVQLVVAHVAPSVPIRIGLGLRYYHHGYQPMSVDEVPDSHLGARASAVLAYRHGPLEIYAEAAPGIDFVRTPSCTLVDGPNSICPHAMAGPFFFQLVLGARWFLSH